MSVTTRSQDKIRKRKIEFDANRSLQHTIPKQRRLKPLTTNMDNSRINTNVGQITDLSGTIISRNLSDSVTRQENGGQSAMNNVNDEIAPEVRELVTDEALMVQKSLEEQVKTMVQAEMQEVKKSIGDLMKVVKDLSQMAMKNSETSTANQAPTNVTASNVLSVPQVTNMSNSNPPNLRPMSNEFNRGGNSAHSLPHVAENQMSTTPRIVSNQIINGNMRHFTPQNNINHIPATTLGVGQFNSNIIRNASNSPLGEGSINSNPNTGFVFGNPQNSFVNPNIQTQKDFPPRTWIRIDKWGINFDGDTNRMSVEDFIFRVERLQAQYDIPLEELERDFHLLVSGPARDWYWLFVQTHFGVKWSGLKQALLSQYQTSRSNFEILRDLVERKQNSNETVDQFFHAMCHIRSKLVQSIPEYDMIKILKRNVKESVARVVYPISVSSVEQLRIECNGAERNFPRRSIVNIQHPMRNNRHINEVYMDMSQLSQDEDSVQEMREVESIQLNQQQKQPVVCWNCKVAGHVFMECPSSERTLFCYRCGKPDVITPNCSTCQQGNSKRGVGLTGCPRRTENPKTTQSLKK